MKRTKKAHRFIWAAVALCILCTILCGCTIVRYGITMGTYVMSTDANESWLFAPRITFRDEKRTFSIRTADAPSDSGHVTGNYKIDKGYVTAKSDDGSYTYVFEIVDNDHIRFVQKKSSECGLTDGTLFEYRGSVVPELGEAFTGEVNTFDGISMEVVQGSVSEAGATIEIENASGKHIMGGNQYEYRIQVLVDGVWYELVGADFANTDEGLLYDGWIGQGLNWYSRYGKLPAGSYRIVKKLWPQGNLGDAFLLSAEFVISEPLEELQQK